MKIIRKEIPLLTHREEIELVFLGDIHLGHKNVDKNYLDSTVNYIKSNPRCFWIGMGDYMDSITVTDKRFDWDNTDLEFKTPNEQYTGLIKIFNPIANKCIGLLTGNHEYTLYQNQKGFDYVNGLCAATSTKEYQVPYATYDAVFILDLQREKTYNDKLANKTIKIYAHHGWTSSRYEGGIATRLSEMINIFPGMDVYAMGHIHRLGAMPLMQQLEIAKVNGKDDIISRNIYRILTGSYLKGYEPDRTSYIEMKTYPPAGIGSTLLKIQPFRSGQNSDYTKITVEIIPDNLP